MQYTCGLHLCVPLEAGNCTSARQSRLNCTGALANKFYNPGFLSLFESLLLWETLEIVEVNNRPFLNYQFTQTAYRNQATLGSAINRGELPVLAGLAGLVKKRLRRLVDDMDDRLCDTVLSEKDALRAKQDGHREGIKRQMKIQDDGPLVH